MFTSPSDRDRDEKYTASYGTPHVMEGWAGLLLSLHARLNFMLVVDRSRYSFR